MSEHSVLSPAAFLSQPAQASLVHEATRDELIVCMTQVDGRWQVESRYGDDVWWTTGATTNVGRGDRFADFRLIASPFREVAKQMLYRLIRKGPDGRSPIRGPTAVRQISTIRLFFNYLAEINITCLTDVSPLACASYVAHCKEHRITATPNFPERPLSINSLYSRLRAVETIYRLSQFTTSPMPAHPWIDSSADHLAGVSKWRQSGKPGRTEQIPDDDFSKLFKSAWSLIEEAPALLDIRDQLKDWRPDREGLSKATIELQRNAWLRTKGFDEGYRRFKSHVLRIRTACYIVVASLSGCRNHELAFVQAGAWYSTLDAEGNRYWWLRSRSTKTDVGETEWMITEGVVTALQILERWAAPMHKLLEREIAELRAVDPTNLRIAQAVQHVGALFVGKDLAQGKTVRTLAISAMNYSLEDFANWCGVKHIPTTHQFRKTFAVYAARSRFGDLRYLREHFKHWSMQMTLAYALNDAQELALFVEIESELDELKGEAVSSWLNADSRLSGGYGRNLMSWRSREEPVVMFKSRADMVKSISHSTSIRSNGHAFCTADDQACEGNDLNKTRCGDGCENAVIDDRFNPVYQGMYSHLLELSALDDIGEPGKLRVRRDLDRCASVLADLSGTPVLRGLDV